MLLRKHCQKNIIFVHLPKIRIMSSNKLIFIILYLGFWVNTFSQNAICRINYANPWTFIKEIEILRNQGKYNLIIEDLKNRINSDSVQFWHYYQVACFYSLKENSDSSFHYLHKAIDKGADGEDILSDTDFEFLHGLPEWQTIKDTLIAIYLRQNPDIRNKELSITLWFMWIEDQKTRSLRRNVKKDFPTPGTQEFKALNRDFQRDTRQRARFVISMVNDGYWPQYIDVGRTAGDAALFIIQHSGRKRYFKKALPLLKDAALHNQASRENYALMLDRHLMNNNKKQIYGTQGIGLPAGRNEEGKQVFKYYIWPIENEKDVNIRRKAMGIPVSIEEHAKRMGIEYIYKPENENKKIKEIISRR